MNRPNYWIIDPLSLLELAGIYVENLNNAPNEVLFHPQTLDDKYQVLDHDEARGMVALAICSMISDCVGYSAPEHIVETVKYSIKSDLEVFIPYVEIDRLNFLSQYEFTIYPEHGIYLKNWGILRKKLIGVNNGYCWEQLKEIAL